ncbi:MAG: hypothetical protein K2X38_14265 [Gemmataceae bacterium]|nr:hypothetical protein [Gemmataceae bacterium]
MLAKIQKRLEKLGIEGLVCVGGDGTLNGMQALASFLPTILAPKTIVTRDSDFQAIPNLETESW